MMQPIEMQARRKALGLSQAELAQRLGASQAAISTWETGARAPRDPISVRLLLLQLADVQSELIDEITGRIEGASAKLNQSGVRVRTYRTDAEYWSDDARAAKLEIPASMHQTAAALAATDAEAELGVTVEIYEA